MPIDRIVLGPHANAHLGSGLFVSLPGINVMDPETAQYANLMFDMSEPHSTLNIIQSGTFKITCSRKAISGRGETIGTREHDPAGAGAGAHTFDHNTGRPSNLTTLANPSAASDPGYHNKSFGKKTKGKQTNYLDTGSHTIQITPPLPNGEIPEVALRFAIGTDENQTNPYTGQIGPTFHPWYANTVLTGDGGSWSDIDYSAYNSGSANSQQIVHMDSNWMRLKWGGLGAEEYIGNQDEYTFDSLVSFFEGFSSTIVDKFGFSDVTDAQNKLKNSKLLSLAINNSQGVVGLIPYVNATSITVDAYMSPTHAGLRRPVDRTFDQHLGRQKGIGFNAIDDYYSIISGAPRPYDSLPGNWGKSQDKDNLLSGNFSDPEDHGKRDMYGWGGHPTEFFVNPFSNANLTFYTHMQPPYLHDKAANTIETNVYDGRYLPTDITDWTWTGSMGLAGAGSKEAMAVDNVWDTFYVSYVIYSNGSVPPPEASVDPGTGFSFVTPAPGSNKVSEDQFWFGYNAKDAIPSIINNFIFPDDLVGTVGDPATDPFAANRDAAGRIYGNMHFNLNLEPGRNYGSEKFSTTTGKPLPAITLDFSETKWNFNNNKGISLTINNHSRIVGGGGAGGFGTRRNVTVTKLGDISEGAKGGGGGGGGGGTGRNPTYGTAETDPSYIGYLGTGFDGKGWGQNFLITPTIIGDDGAQGSGFFASGVGGAKADALSTQNITESFFGNGGEGGDAIEIIHPNNIQPLIEIVNSNTGIIIGGGGGGAGGYEVDGGDGGAAGNHGQGSAGNWIANTGGNPGYVIVGSNDTYYRSIRIININNGLVQGRNPWLDSHDITDTSGGLPGVWVLTGNNTTNSSLPATGIYREGI